MFKLTKNDEKSFFEKNPTLPLDMVGNMCYYLPINRVGRKESKKMLPVFTKYFLMCSGRMCRRSK